jgi:hypothetical protein
MIQIKAGDIFMAVDPRRYNDVLKIEKDKGGYHAVQRSAIDAYYIVIEGVSLLPNNLALLCYSGITDVMGHGVKYHGRTCALQEFIREYDAGELVLCSSKNEERT